MGGSRDGYRMSALAIGSQAVRLEDVGVRYRDVVAIDCLNLDLPAGEILALLGPSGCGKSTLLRSVAGFVPHTGEIHIGGQRVTRVPPHRRNIGMVFQDYALFPHMTVAENIGFGLKMRHVERQEAEKRVSEALSLVGLQGLDGRMARQLSGGQQQRVALARSLVINPSVLLLDEPLSALDKKLREEMRGELRRIQRVTGVTTIFVTHDQDEALGLADRLALMSDGSLLQYGKPEEIYRRPLNPFVARFLGVTNAVNAICKEIDAHYMTLEIPLVGSVRASTAGRPVGVGENANLFVRPERIVLGSRGGKETGHPLEATVTSKTYLGRYIECGVRLNNGTLWTVNLADEAGFAELKVGSEVFVNVDPRDFLVYADETAEQH
jgi:putative spermidine/putrescine transport system ATP-binding protein